MPVHPAGRGRLWRVDQHRIIQNDADIRHLTAPYDALIRDATAAYITHLADDLHSIYVTGTISRGLAIVGQSDLDMFAVLAPQIDPELVMQDWIDPAERRILAAHDCVSDVQLELWPYGYVFRDPAEFSVGAFIIQTHAVCVWGSSLTAQLPDYRVPDDLIAIANDDVVQIEPDIAEAKAALRDNPKAGNVRYWCKRICKNIVRAGFGLVNRQVKEHTRDVELCAYYVAQTFSDKTAEIQQAVDWIARPIEDAGLLLAYLDDFGGWLIDQADLWLDEHNPERLIEYNYGEEDEE